MPYYTMNSAALRCATGYVNSLKLYAMADAQV